MTITLYSCGCIHVSSETNRDAPTAPPWCTQHRTMPDEVQHKRYGFIGLDRRQNRYVWSSTQETWIEVSGQIRCEQLHGPDLGSVDAATLRPVGGRRQVQILRGHSG